MKKLTHDEWQLLVKKEKELLKERLETIGEPENNKYEAAISELEKIKKGGSTCLDCTLGRSLPH